MTFTLLVHMSNEEPFVADVEELPNPEDQVLVLNSPRRRDGKDVDGFLPEVVTLLVPWHRIHFIEVMPTDEAEDLFTFIRE